VQHLLHTLHQHLDLLALTDAISMQAIQMAVQEHLSIQVLQEPGITAQHLINRITAQHQLRTV
ncbi:hypothetical protein NL529_27925, partial [Klebsiella pneumoniae]|nr:hypothetical protein [Klebsiella pneumoniae]